MSWDYVIECKARVPIRYNKSMSALFIFKVINLTNCYSVKSENKRRWVGLQWLIKRICLGLCRATATENTQNMTVLIGG